MKKSIVIGLHIGFWLFYIALTIALVGLHSESLELIQDESFFEDTLWRALFFTLIPSVISFYSFYFLVFRYLRQKRIALSILYSISVSVGAAILGTFLMGIFLGIDSLSEAKEPASVGVLFVSLIDILTGIVALLIKGFVTWFEELKLREQLAQKNHEMEMVLVKSQLDPHFLFNTLNNIDVLILKNAAEASDYLNKLCDIMRFMLYETKTDNISMAKEIEYIEKYIALQKIRTANPNYILFEITGNPTGKKIAPMIFLPFIENAFKHTTNKKMDHAITVHIKIEKDRVKFTCLNKFDPNRKGEHQNGGLGNDLIKKRLQLIYPEQHQLEVVNGREQYSVVLTINQ